MRDHFCPESLTGRHCAAGNRDSRQAQCDYCDAEIVRAHTRSAWWYTETTNPAGNPDGAVKVQQGAE